MLMAKRRGRPGAHGGRRAQAQAQVGHARPVRGQPLREAVSIGTISRGDDLSDFDRTSPQGSPWKSTESTGTSNIQNIRSLSSKHSASHDSDAWHSESEANWTMVETYSNQPKDISQSQVLSEDEQKQMCTPNWSKSVITEQQSISASPQAPGGEKKRYSSLALHRRDFSVDSSEGWNLQGTTCNFEPRRPLEIFGECSWNSLSLATNSNLVQSASGMTQDVVGLSLSMLHAGVSDISNDIETLKKLIVNAGQAATNLGPFVSTNKAAVHFTLNSRDKSATKRSTTFNVQGKSPSHDLNSLPSLDDITSECSKLSPSKKPYGKQVTRNRSSTYPRVTSVWCKSTPLKSTQAPLLRISVPNSAAAVKLSIASKSPARLRRISRMSKTGSRRASRGGYSVTDKDDIFDKEVHQQRYIIELLYQTTSSVHDARKSSIQALGLLPFKSEEVEKRLQEIMMSDSAPLVQYEAFKSLLSLGIVNTEIISFAGTCLRGSALLSYDLLSFLSQDHIIKHLSKKCDDIQLSLVEVLHQDLLGLLKEDHSRLSFLIALLFSEAGLEQELCLEPLKQTLSSSSPEHQNQALCCLIKCWKCHDSVVVCSALQQMKKLHNWKLRQRSIEYLTTVDKKSLIIISTDETKRNIYDVLLDRLPNEPILVVRLAIGKLLTHLELRTKAEHTLIGKLEHKNEVIRTEAITALSAFDNPSSKNVRAFIECLNFDPSNYVRVQVVRLFSNMWHRNPLILNQLIEKSRGTGHVAQECLAVLARISKT
ncbi:uncharacterized protein LOC135345005 isoform X2 [Halichondria panicea]